MKQKEVESLRVYHSLQDERLTDALTLLLQIPHKVRTRFKNRFLSKKCVLSGCLLKSVVYMIYDMAWYPPSSPHCKRKTSKIHEITVYFKAICSNKYIFLYLFINISHFICYQI